MKNKKGFTLVELLVTITILGILMTVAGASVLVYLNKSEIQAVDTMIKSSYDGTVNYMMENNILLNPKNQAGSTFEISIEDLYNLGYIERPTDPKDKTNMCSGKVTASNNTTSSTLGLTDYSYKVEVVCSGGLEKNATFNQ